MTEQEAVAYLTPHRLTGDGASVGLTAGKMREAVEALTKRIASLEIECAQLRGDLHSMVESRRAAIGIVNFSSRQSVRNFIEPLLRRNKAIFDAYGPNNTYRENPEAEEARVWQRMMVSQIIPNNQSILMVIDSNISLMNEGELKTLELFRQHVDDLVERHLGEDRTVASRFPSDMATIFSDD